MEHTYTLSTLAILFLGIPVQYTTSPQLSGATTQWVGLFGASVDPAAGPYTNATFDSFNAYIFAT
ncbi:MAG: hypothetical protein LC664_08340, partial [Flavobacteriales bacterium]|nr:hypothetical protein [Flavobacteriales bacterium]